MNSSGPTTHEPRSASRPVSKLKIRISGGAIFLREIGSLVVQERALQSSLEESLDVADDDFSMTTHGILEDQRREVAAGISRLEHDFDLPAQSSPAIVRRRPALSGGWQGIMPTAGQRILADIAALHGALCRTVDLLIARRPRAGGRNQILVEIARGHEKMAASLTAISGG